MFKKLNLLFILFLVSFMVQGQKQMLNSEVSSLHAVKRLDLPALDNAQLLKRYAVDSKQYANRFAEARDINLSPSSDDTWESTKSGLMVWRHIVKSPGAHTINLGFTKFKLSDSAQLFIYNPDQTEILGPFTKADNDDHLQLWTPIISGDEVVIELHIKPEEIADNQLLLSRVNHDFKNITKSIQSGSCNLDVICGAPDGWAIVDNYRDIISSVGAYSFNGIDQCSGVLINNTRNDCKPYFLTAEHCGISNSNAPSVVVYWNYQNSFCRQPNSVASGSQGDGVRTKFNSGAILRAELGASDFTLIELDDPLNTDLDLYLAGWNIGRTLPDTSICIHHPGVEEKRISFEFDRLGYDPTGSDTTHLLVNDWDIGTTEGGSSGSPIFNTKKQIIGQLTGGLAACGNNEYDSFGWMRRSWTGSGQLQNSLRPWLDPDNTGVTQMQGRSCNYSILTDASYFDICGLNQDSLVIDVRADGLFSGIVNYSVSGLPSGLSATFKFNSGPLTLQNKLTVTGFSGLSISDFSFTIQASDGSNSASSTIFVGFSANLPMVPVTIKPTNGNVNVSLIPNLQVMRNQANQYYFEIASDLAFSNIVFSQLSNNYIVKANNLKESTTYYWRARTINICGNSGWSPVSSFTTASVFCTKIYSSGAPVEISSSAPNSVQSGIDFPYGVIIEDVNVSKVIGTHEYIEDLIFTLGYDNKYSVLMSEICGDVQDFNLGFDDQASSSEIPCPPTDGRSYIPVSPLSVFNGVFAGGTWELDIEDTAFLDGGKLNEWSMDICFSNPALSVIVPKDHRTYNCNTMPVIEAFIYSTAPDWDIIVKDSNGNELNTEHSQGNSHSSAQFIAFSDKSELKAGKNQLVVELVNQNHTEVLAFAFMELFVEDEIGVASITHPQQNAIIRLDELNSINWSSNYPGAFIVELSTDANFKNVFWTQEGNNAQNIPFMEFLENGVYYLRIVLEDGNCQSYSESVTFEIRGSLVSTNEINTTNFRIYPNPTQQLLKVEGPIEKGNSISIYDIKGQELLRYNVRQQSDRWEGDLSFLPKGIYIIVINQQDETYRSKFVKL